MSGEELKVLELISNKLSILIALQLVDLPEPSRARGSGKVVSYLAGFGLDAKEIAAITGSPIQSVRTLLTPKRREK